MSDLNLIKTTTLDNASNDEAREAIMGNIYNADNPVVRSHAAITSQHQDGTYSFTTVDYDVNRDVQLKVSTRGIVEDHFNVMADDFAKLVNNVRDGE